MCRDHEYRPRTEVVEGACFAEPGVPFGILIQHEDALVHFLFQVETRFCVRGLLFLVGQPYFKFLQSEFGDMYLREGLLLFWNTGQIYLVQSVLISCAEVPVVAESLGEEIANSE